MPGLSAPLLFVYSSKYLLVVYFSIILLRKAEKEEERRAREKIRQKVEEDKVDLHAFFHYIFIPQQNP